MISSSRILGIFSLAMINVAAVVSLRNLPLMAGQGLAALFFYAVAAFAFLIPTALVCAELATTFRGAGGVWRWTRIALGPKVAFLTVWLSWMITIAFLPTLTLFIATNIAYIIDPRFAHNPTFMTSIVLAILWGGTLANCYGMRLSSLLSSIGVIIGTIIPGFIIVALGTFWFFSGKPLYMTLSWDAFTPDLRLENLVFLVGVVLAFEGMELTAFHANDVHNPQRDYPRAILLATILIIVLSVLGSLSIAFVVPKENINLVEGVMQTFTAFMHAFNLDFLVPLVACSLVVGSLTGLVTWIIAPAKGVYAANEDGYLPSFFKKVNVYNVPVGLLIFQACVCSLLACTMIVMPNLESAYWALSMLAVIFALAMYMIVFVSSIKLRYDFPTVQRPYQVPGKRNFGMWLVAGIGFITCVASTIISFVPPDRYEGSWHILQFFLLISFTLMISPAVWMIYRKP